MSSVLVSLVFCALCLHGAGNLISNGENRRAKPNLIWLFIGFLCSAFALIFYCAFAVLGMAYLFMVVL